MVTLQGIFNWPRNERVSDRYGAFILDPGINGKQLKSLVGKRCRVTATVDEVKPCYHIGDMFHGFGHTEPEAGEVHEIGVGVVGLTPCDDVTAVVISPDDGRETFWLEPMTLYRLNQQLVTIRIEPTDDPCTSYPFWCFQGSEQPEPEWAKKLRKKE